MCAVALVAMAGFDSGASGAPSAAEFVQMTIVVPARLDNEAAWMHRALQPMNKAGQPTLDLMKVNGKRTPIFWSNAGIGTTTTDDILRYAAKPYGGAYGRDALMVDRKLTPGEQRIFSVVPLWTDADVLLVEPDSALCATGLTIQRARALLRGRDRSIRIAATLVRSGTARPSFDVFPAKAIRTAQESALISTPVGPGEAAAVGFQLARPAIEAGTACAAPINGVAPTVATVRSGRYPVSRPVGFAFNKAVYRSKNVGAYGNAIRTRFLQHVKGPLGKAFIKEKFGAGALPGW